MKKPIKAGLKIMFLYILLPIVFVLFILSGINYIYSTNLQNSIIRQQERTLTHGVNMINQLTGNVVMSSKMFVLSEDLMRVLYMQESGVELNAADHYQIIEGFRKYKATSELVAGITIVDRYNMRVISESGVFSFYTYFGDSYQYEQYPVSFWEKATAEKGGYEVLSMSYKQGTNKTVIPIVFNGIMNASPKSLVIIDLDCEKIQRNFLNISNGEIGDIYLLDVEKGNMIGSAGNQLVAADFTEKKFLEKLNKRASFTHKWDGETYLVVSSNEDQLMFDKIRFVSIVPMESIMRNFNRIKIVVFFAYLLSLFLLVFLINYITTRFYRPLRWIAGRIEAEEGESGKGEFYELDHLKAGIDKMLHQNATYQQQMSMMMPLACDRYFEKLLKSGDMAVVEEFETFMQESNIQFVHKYFSVISVKLRFTEKYYQQFSSVEHANVREGILQLFSSAVGADNAAYILPVDDTNYLLIVNLPDAVEEFNQMVERISHITESFSNDIEFVRIEVSFGNPYETYEGMRKSYDECINCSHKIADKSCVWIGGSNGTDYKYTINDENRLFNMMIKGDADSVEDLIKEIINNSIETGIGYQELRNLYLQIYNTIQKVISAKNITDRVLMGDEYINVYESVELMDNDSLFQYLYLLMKEATVYNNAPNSKLNLGEITNYINENYDQEIYLELLAEKYGTSVRYLSRVLKNYLGVSYIEYLGRVRIEHAKEFLEQTNLPVNDIMLRCGFNSRNTFIRTFKKYVGIVPGEYRSIYGGRTEAKTEQEVKS